MDANKHRPGNPNDSWLSALLRRHGSSEESSQYDDDVFWRTCISFRYLDRGGILTRLW